MEAAVRNSLHNAGFFFLVCPDVGLLQEELKTITAGLGGSDFDTIVYRGDHDEFPGRFWDELGMPNLMGKRKVLVLRRADAQNAEFWKALVPRLAGFNEACRLIVCMEGDWTKGNWNSPSKAKLPATLTKQKYWKVAEKKGWIWTSPGLDARTLASFAESYLGERGVKLQKSTAARLAEALPEDAAAAKTELEKLALWVGEGNEVRPEDLQVISHTAEMDFYAFMNAAITGSNLPQVWKVIVAEKEAASGDGVFFRFLFGLQREARMLWQLAVGEGQAVRLPPKVKQSKEAMARRLGTQGLARLWDLILEAEMGVKTGNRSPEQAFEALAAGLSRLSGAKQGQMRRSGPENRN
jgi:DNA polymerase-3 subunit delta